MSEQQPPELQVHLCSTNCKDGKHDWSGPLYYRELPGGGDEGGVTCAKCGMEYGHWMLFNLP